MKGSCVSVGAERLARLCTDLEARPDRASEIRSGIEAEMTALSTALRSELHERGAAREKRSDA
ncbi:hypothetical protein D3C83_276720 [compost metagenome]